MTFIFNYLFNYFWHMIVIIRNYLNCGESISADHNDYSDYNIHNNCYCQYAAIEMFKKMIHYT